MTRLTRRLRGWSRRSPRCYWILAFCGSNDLLEKSYTNVSSAVLHAFILVHWGHTRAPHWRQAIWVWPVCFLQDNISHEKTHCKNWTVHTLEAFLQCVFSNINDVVSFTFDDRLSLGLEQLVLTSTAMLLSCTSMINQHSQTNFSSLYQDNYYFMLSLDNCYH